MRGSRDDRDDRDDRDHDNELVLVDEGAQEKRSLKRSLSDQLLDYLASHPRRWRVPNEGITMPWPLCCFTNEVRKGPRPRRGGDRSFAQEERESAAAVRTPPRLWTSSRRRCTDDAMRRVQSQPACMMEML